MTQVLHLEQGSPPISPRGPHAIGTDKSLDKSLSLSLKCSHFFLFRLQPIEGEWGKAVFVIHKNSSHTGVNKQPAIKLIKDFPVH